MSSVSHEGFKILFNKVWSTTDLAENISRIDRRVLRMEYEELRRRAPQRWSKGKRYFVETHDGSLSTSGGSNRFEEHLAIALWREDTVWRGPRTGRFRLLDYQVPLKAQGSDKTIGNVDLLGVTDRGQLTVIEMKVKPEGRMRRGESPVAALIQGLRYAAIVEANRASIAKEAKERFDTKIVEEPPIVQILAPIAWWFGWLQLVGSTRRAAGHWESNFAELARDIEEQLGVVVECVALDDLKPTDIDYGSDGNQPQISRAVMFYPVCVGETTAIGPALAPYGSEG